MENSVFYISCRYRYLFGIVIFISLVISVILGAGLPMAENCIIIPVKGLSINESISNIIGLCIVDVVMLWLLAVPLSDMLSIAQGTLIFFIRGLVIGSNIATVSHNSVTYEILVMLLVYCAVTLLSLLYYAFLNFNNVKNLFVRIASCTIVTGAVIAIKSLSLLLIN